MSKATFINLTLKKGNIDLSEYVKGLTFDDTTEEDSIVEIQIRAEYAIKLLESEHLTRNAIITFQFGFIGDQASPVHTAQIQDIDANYAETVTLTIRAKDLGCNTKKTTSIKIWNKVKSKDIVQTIADRYEMEYEVDDSTKTWNNVPQGHKSDFDFLHWLAARETDGNFIFFVRDNKMYFVRRGLNKSSLLTYTYGDAKIISFKPKERETTKQKDSEGISVASGEKSSDVSKDRNGISTGDKKYVYNAYTSKTGERVQTENKESFNAKDGVMGSITKFGKNLITPSTDDVENSNLGNSKKKKAAFQGMTADLALEGNPFLSPNVVITMNNVAKRHSGNWLVSKVKHTISADGAYTTTLGLKKNAGKTGDAKTENSVNKTTGKDAANNKGKEPVKVKIVYDANTKPVAKRNGDSYTAPK